MGKQKYQQKLQHPRSEGRTWLEDGEQKKSLKCQQFLSCLLSKSSYCLAQFSINDFRLFGTIAEPFHDVF